MWSIQRGGIEIIVGYSKVIGRNLLGTECVGSWPRSVPDFLHNLGEELDISGLYWGWLNIFHSLPHLSPHFLACGPNKR